MRWIHFLMILLTSFLSPGHTAQPVPEGNRVVTQIEVIAVHNGQSASAVYTDSAQIESILTYLRVTDPSGTTQFEPDSFRADCYTFVIYFSDGSQNIYRQIYHDYLQKNDGRWQRIGPKADLLFPPL